MVFRKWVDKIKKIDLDNKNNGRYRFVSFFDLFDSPGSIPKQLHKHDVRFGYGSYMHKSMALHGSTMEQFIQIDDSIVAPKIKSNEDDIQNNFLEVVSSCNQIFVHLAAINHFVLKKPEMRK